MEKKLQKKMLYTMMLIREFEEIIAREKLEGSVYGAVHCCQGEEAIATGVCSALNTEDYIISNHRPHGHAIAKGMPLKPIMAEIFGKETGSNRGKGGSMHIQDKSVGLIAATGIVGSGIPLGCGAAFSAKYKQDGKIACVFFGDGAANEGTLHESLNLAAKWKLPILFVLEDNGLAVTTSTRSTSAVNDYTKFAEAYGMDGVIVDGQDVEQVYQVAAAAVEKARKQSTPTLIQAQTVRFREHAEGEYYLRMRDTGYRNYQELEDEKTTKDPVRLYEQKLIMTGCFSKDETAKLRNQALQEVQEALQFAIDSVTPVITEAFQNVFI